MANQGTRWLAAHWTQAKEMLDAGKSLEEAAAAINSGVPRLKNKVRWECSMNAEQKARRAAGERRRRGYHLRGVKPVKVARPYDPLFTPPRLRFERPSPAPTPKLIAERDARLSVRPRDLTALLCGDPLPGYSALERRA